MKIAIVIPAYNEEAAIGAVVQHLQQVAAQLSLDLTPVVVNDCSQDRTAEIARTLPCVLLDLPVNLGIGGAVQTGMMYAYQQGYDVAIQMDGDGQHPASELPQLLAPLRTDAADVIIGSRFIAGEGFQSSMLRRTGISWFRHLIRALTGTDIKDTTSGFRAYNRQAQRLLCAYYPDEYPEPEALVYLLRKGCRIAEVPVQMRERQGGVSSIRSLKTVYYMGKVTLAILFTYLRKD